MKLALIFASSHGRTRKVAGSLAEKLPAGTTCLDLGVNTDPATALAHDHWILLCPTYGDEELQPDMECFLAGLPESLHGIHFVIAEFGNYYGYDDFSFGALAILRKFLLQRGAVELPGHVSIDAIPRLNEDLVNRWIHRMATDFAKA